MSKSIVINLGHGDLNNGFPRVTAQLWAAGHPLPEQFIGSLPAVPDLIDVHRNWQLIYQNLCDRKHLLSRSHDQDDELEIDEGAVTNVSIVSFDRLCQKLEESINVWLKSPEFLHIDRQLRSALDPAAEIRVIIETNDEKLRRLPWHRWDLFEDYPKAEMALSRLEYKRREFVQQLKDGKVRILAILGNSQDIDLETEASLLNNLPDAHVVFLVNPSRQELNEQLWQDSGWDVLFFAGHSQTKGKTGLIYINENKTNNSLTIEQLDEALKQAIEKGLKLAIFNSCDGLGLANALEKLNIPQVIVMREPVPNLVAQEFFKHFLNAFAVERLPLYLALRQARKKLQALEDDFPGASWLPVICQNPAVEPPTWLHLGGIPPCPYRGLFAFREEDALLFKGRSQFTNDLVAALKTKPLVAIVGSSGSGKSSVLFAGLIPHLRVGTQGFPPAKIVSFRPGNDPFEALAAAIAPLLLPTWGSQGAGGAGGAEGSEENASLCAFASLRDTNPKSKIQNRFAPSAHYASTILEIPSPDRSLELKATSFEDEARYSVEQELAAQIAHYAIAFRQDQAALAEIIETLVQQKIGTHVVLIADQFEEITLCPESEKQAFLDLLLTAVRLAPAFNLVLTMRADFYEYALSYRPLSDALQGAVYNLEPMSCQELRSAIEQPAAQMQVRLEKDLTNVLVNEFQGYSGRLALLEFTLTTLWAKQKDGLLTHQAYEAIGGVESALANHAEAVYAQLSAADRLRAQQIFMQLVRLGESQASRCSATRDEVKAENWDLVTRLASSRLVVTNRSSTGEETVEIVHEALIRSWGRLEHWMQVNGEFRRWQEQMRAAKRQWHISNKDEEALLRGKPLADAQYWQSQRLDELSSGDKCFIRLSLALRDSEIYKHKRRRQNAICWLSSGWVVALILAGLAWWQWQNSANDGAISSSSEALFVSNEKLDVADRGN